MECLLAPDFSEAARRVLEARPNLRLLKIPGFEIPRSQELRTVAGGLLRQSLDHSDPPGTQAWQVVTPTSTNGARAGRHAVCMAGLPAGQVKCDRAGALAGASCASRWGSAEVNLTVWIACASPANEPPSGLPARCWPPTASSPFPNGVEAAAALGVTAIAQPGGSRRDQEVIEAADAAGLAMALTGMRHFRH